MPGKRVPPPPSRAPKFGEPGYDPNFGYKGEGYVTPSPTGADRFQRLPPGRHPGNRGAGGRGADERQKDYLGTSGSYNTGGGGGGGDGGFIPPQDGGGGGGGGEPAPLTWSETYTVPGSPSWWKGLTPSALDPQAEYAMLVNSLIPFMSPEDARIAGANLGQVYPETFNIYNLDVTPAIPAPSVYSPVSAPKYSYLSQSRGQNVLNTLEQVRSIMGKPATDFGPGYQWLRNVASVLRDYGGAGQNQQTRAQFLAQQSTLDPLLAQAKSDMLAAYGPAAQYLTQPFSQQGGPRDAYQDENKNWHFGRPNSWLY